MQKLYKVDACHPVAKRIIESKLTEVERNDLVAELTEAGYEDIQVTENVYYKDGDTIEITRQFIMDNMKNDEFFRLIEYIVEQKAKNLGVDLLDVGKDALLPLKGTLKNLRINRTFGHVIVSWDIGDDPDGCDRWQQTNVHALEKVGFKFLQPDFEDIPIMNADDNLLHEDELVVKYYALQNEISIEDAEAVISKVRSAMGKNGIVFYRP